MRHNDKEAQTTVQFTWTQLRRAAAAVAARWRARTTRIHVTPLKPEWLRLHEIEAGKHSGLH